MKNAFYVQVTKPREGMWYSEYVGHLFLVTTAVDKERYELVDGCAQIVKADCRRFDMTGALGCSPQNMLDNWQVLQHNLRRGGYLK